MPFTLHPAVHAALAARMGPNPPPPPPVGDWKTRRAQLDIAFSGLSQNQPLVSDVSTQDFTTVTPDNHPLTLRWFSKSHTTTNAGSGPAILYAHGGGMIALGLKHYDQIIKRYVSRTSVPFLLVDYRLAPEVRAPIPVTDLFAGLVWLHSHAPELGTDPNRIGIMGDSAGGGITASLAHYLKLHGPAAGLPPVAKQILIYPMLDDRTTLTTTSSNHEELPFLTWTLSDNTTGWTCLLGADRVNTPQITVLEAPGRMTLEEAKNLPPTYIDVGELDLFRVEDIEYAQTLGKAGVSVELHVIPRAPHAFESFAPEADISQFVMECRERVIKSI